MLQRRRPGDLCNTFARSHQGLRRVAHEGAARLAGDRCAGTGKIDRGGINDLAYGFL